MSPPITPVSPGFSDTCSTVYGGETIERDLEKQDPKEIDRSIGHYLGQLTPAVITSNLDDIDEEEWASEADESQHKKTYDRIDDHPLGYPKLAAFQNSDENFLICRQFATLHSRVLIHRQDEIRELEQELYDLDARVAKEDETSLKSRARDKRQATGRGDLIDKIDEKLQQYNDIVMRTRGMASLQKATHRNYTSVADWIHQNAPLVQDEASVFSQSRDFVSIVDAKEGSWFDSQVEAVLGICDFRVTRKIFMTRHGRKSTENHNVRLWSKHRIDIFSRLFMTILAVIILMGPVIALFRTTDHAEIKIIIIFVSTLIFSSTLAACTKAKRQEVFAVTATYCAVLVVFLGNITPTIPVSNASPRM